MRQHPEIGTRIAVPFEYFAAGALAIRHHPERWHESGYPEGLRGEPIPLGARIVTVADVYGALTSARPYREALDPEATLAHLAAEAGSGLARWSRAEPVTWPWP